MDHTEQPIPSPQRPAIPPPGPTPKNKIGLWLTGAAVAIIAVSLLFSNGGTTPRKSKLFTGQQQPASPNDISAFEAETAADAERARRQAEALRQTQQKLAAFEQAPVAGETVPPCQNTREGCYGYQPQQTATSAADAAAAERKARRERQLHASPLALEIPVSAAATEPVEIAKTEGLRPSVDKTEDADPVQTVAEKKTQVASFDSWTGKLYRIFEGTFLEVVVKNRINGDAAGPVEAMLTNDVYSLNTQHLLLPKGTVLIGEARAVTGQFQQRLFVGFHRLICPDGFSVNLDQFHGLSQQGDVGLEDKVNHHYLSIFGTAIALAAIGGVSNIGNTSVGGNYSPSVQFRAGIATQMGEAADRVLDRYLNRLPTIVIREGARSRIFVSQDFVVPAYADHRMDSNL